MAWSIVFQSHEVNAEQTKLVKHWQKLRSDEIDRNAPYTLTEPLLEADHGISSGTDQRRTSGVVRRRILGTQ
jgi:hypothetical protein